MQAVFDAVFQSFWTFFGTVILLEVGLTGLAEVIRAIKGKA